MTATLSTDYFPFHRLDSYCDIGYVTHNGTRGVAFSLTQIHAHFTVGNTESLVEVQSHEGRGQAPVPFMGLQDPRGREKFLLLTGCTGFIHVTFRGQGRPGCARPRRAQLTGGWEKPRTACPLVPRYFTEGRSMAPSTSELVWDVCAREMTGEAMSPTARESLTLGDLWHQGLQNSESREWGPSHPFLSF